MQTLTGVVIKSKAIKYIKLLIKANGYNKQSFILICVNYLEHMTKKGTSDINQMVKLSG